MIKAAFKQLIWRLAPSLFQRLSTRYEGQCFSISIYEGERLDRLKPHSEALSPVLTSQDITDVPALFVADPFMINNKDKWFMFFEVMENITRKGKIGVATSSDLSRWHYHEIVLNEPFHLAYPYVFEHDGDIYMIPDSPGNGIRLYKAQDFPRGWSLVKKIQQKDIYCDNSIVQHDGVWWLFSAWAPDKSAPKKLRLFFADRPDGDWVEHPASPVASRDQSITRPAGRIFKDKSDRMFRFAQDGTRAYGESVFAVEILQLDHYSYQEKKVNAPILGPGKEAWSQGGMHHIDVHCIGNRLFCCVDGWQLV